jgi:predicted metal-dependent peptidase
MMPVRSVDVKEFTGYVWNLETRDHTFSVPYFLTHNCALLHISRTGGRNKELANIAQDIVVNNLVIRAHMALPKGIIVVDTYRDWCDITINGVQMRVENISEKIWEQIYDELLQTLTKAGRSPSQMGKALARMGFDDHMEGDGEGNQLSQEEVEAAGRKWQKAIVDAATYAKQQGKMPLGMERMIDELLKPKLPWRGILLKYLRPYLNPSDWSYHKPSRKSQQLEVYLPTVVRESVEVEVIVDTSGSIGKEQLTEFLSEIVGIATAMSHVTMWVTFVDAQVNSRYKVDNGDIPKILAMEPKGGGGTSMEVGLDYVKKHNGQVPVVVVLTDGYDSYERKERDYPFEVLWVITNGGQEKMPYGRKIQMG